MNAHIGKARKTSGDATLSFYEENISSAQFLDGTLTMLTMANCEKRRIVATRVASRYPTTPQEWEAISSIFRRQFSTTVDNFTLKGRGCQEIIKEYWKNTATMTTAKRTCFVTLHLDVKAI